MRTNAKGYTESLQDLVQEYRAAGQPWPTDSKSIASWLVRQKKWIPTRRSAIDLLAPQLSRAMREEFFTDPQGRRVRKKHAVRESERLPDGTLRQHTIWVEMDDPETNHKRMRNAFQLRRGQVLGDCHRLKTDVESYNENWNPESAIMMLWDFTDDLLEMEQSTEYADSEEDGDADDRV